MKPPPDGATLPLSSLEESELLLEELFELLELLELSFWLFEEDVLSFFEAAAAAGGLILLGFLLLLLLLGFQLLLGFFCRSCFFPLLLFSFLQAPQLPP